jgi:hypothetical protein
MLPVVHTDLSHGAISSELEGIITAHRSPEPRFPFIFAVENNSSYLYERHGIRSSTVTVFSPFHLPLWHRATVGRLYPRAPIRR